MQKQTFGGSEARVWQSKTAEIVLVPVPYDATSTWGKGADKGPDALFEASAHMELYDIETNSEVCRRGILTDEPVDSCDDAANMAESVKERTAAHLADGRFTVVIGGEHSVSTGAIQAHAERYRGMSVLHLDAHTDLRDEYEGSRYNHACVMARVREVCPIVQVGIRSMCLGEMIERDRVFFAEEIRKRTAWMDQAVELLRDKVYITLDLDVFDPAIMPSTGTPEPGGMGWYEVLDLVRKVFEQKKVVGFDVVELCPNPANKAPDFLAAKLVYKMLSYKFAF